MAVDEELTARIRSVVALDPRVTEKRMFGGLCFLLDGKILVAARGNGSLLVQCGSEASAAATSEPGVTPMVMRGKQMVNFVDVEADLLETDEQLERWIAIAERYVSSKPGRD